MLIGRKPFSSLLANAEGSEVKLSKFKNQSIFSNQQFEKKAILQKGLINHLLLVKGEATRPVFNRNSQILQERASNPKQTTVVKHDKGNQFSGTLNVEQVVETSMRSMSSESIHRNAFSDKKINQDSNISIKKNDLLARYLKVNYGRPQPDGRQQIRNSSCPQIYQNISQDNEPKQYRISQQSNPQRRISARNQAAKDETSVNQNTSSQIINNYSIPSMNNSSLLGSFSFGQLNYPTESKDQSNIFKKSNLKSSSKSILENKQNSINNSTPSCSNKNNSPSFKYLPPAPHQVVLHRHQSSSQSSRFINSLKIAKGRAFSLIRTDRVNIFSNNNNNNNYKNEDLKDEFDFKQSIKKAEMSKSVLQLADIMKRRVQFCDTIHKIEYTPHSEQS